MVNSMKTRSTMFMLAVATLALATGCATKPAKLGDKTGFYYRTGPPQTTSRVPLLASLQSGKTTRLELEHDWGPPSATLQHDRLVFYRLVGSGSRLRFCAEADSFKSCRHSLVLIFNTNGVLEKSSLVRIR